VPSTIEPDVAITPTAAATSGADLLRAITSASCAPVKKSAGAPWTDWRAGSFVNASSMPPICRIWIACSE
jgi:hypothetical protein